MFGPCEEAGVPGENPLKLHVQILHKVAYMHIDGGVKLRTFCCEATMLPSEHYTTSSPHIYMNIQMKLKNHFYADFHTELFTENFDCPTVRLSYVTQNFPK